MSPESRGAFILPFGGRYRVRTLVGEPCRCYGGLNRPKGCRKAGMRLIRRGMRHHVLLDSGVAIHTIAKIGGVDKRDPSQ